MIIDQDAILLTVPFGKPRSSAYSPRYSWNNATRGKEEFVILQWTLEGEGCFGISGKAWPVKAEEAFIAIVPEASEYYFPKQSQGPWKFAWLNIYGSLGVSLFRRFRAQFGPVVPLPRRSAAGMMFLRLAELASTGKLPDPHKASAECYAFLMEWSHQLTRPMMQAGDPVQVAMTLCATRFREPLGVKEMAAQTGLSREHFTRIFTASTGKSPAGYLRELRVNAARQMLRGQDAPLKEVALRCGFPSVRSLKRALAE